MSLRLPRPDGLLVERSKITGYLLCDTHKDGASKATFFASFGFHVADWQAFAIALRQHGRDRDVVAAERNDFGIKYVVRCKLLTPDARNPCIDSVWIVEDEGAPRLVTAYPNR